MIYALSLIATLFAAGTYITWPGGWSIYVAALLPPLLALYGVSARSPALAAGRFRFVPAFALGAAALVELSALPFAYLDPIGYPARLVEERRRWDAVFAKRNAEFEARAIKWEQDIGKLGPDSSLAAWLEYARCARRAMRCTSKPWRARKRQRTGKPTPLRCWTTAKSATFGAVEA